MRLAVEQRDRWLALGLLALAVAAVYLLLIHPWWTAPMLAEGARIDELQARELRARMQLEQAPQIGQALIQAQQAQARSAGFLSEATTELATAGLIKRLETVVSEASPGNRSCAITNRSPFADARQGERYTRVTVQVRLRCGVEPTSAVLYALENDAPRLFIDNLNILAQNYFAMNDQSGSQSGGLDVSFDLYGYLRPRPGGARAAASAAATSEPASTLPAGRPQEDADAL